MKATEPNMMLRIEDIGELSADDYVGLIDPDAVECLKARLSVEGLLTPIWVRRNGNAAKMRWSVIAGRHRLRAAAALGWTEIAAEERAGPQSQSDELQRLQLAENLDRRTLRPIERAMCLMVRWLAVAETMPGSEPHNQQTHAIRARWSVWATVAHTRAIDDAIAETSGPSSRSVRQYRQLYDRIVVGLPEHFAALNAHPLGESLSAMTTLASIKVPDARRKAAEMILSRTDWGSISEALVASGIRLSTGFRVDPRQPDETAFLNAWSKMSGPMRKSHFLRLARGIPPSLVEEAIDILREMLP